MFNYFIYLKARHLEKKGEWKKAAEVYKSVALHAKDESGELSYRRGFVSEKIKDWKTAEDCLRTAVKKQPKKAQWLYRLALALENNKKFVQAAEFYQDALAMSPDKVEWLYRLGRCLRLSGKAEAAEAPLEKAIERSPSEAKYVRELALVIRKQGRTWQEIEILQRAIALNGKNAEWHFDLGEAQDKMNRFAEAGEAFSNANQLKPGNAIWHFREGYAWERASIAEKAQTAYAAACKADKTLKAQQFGIGVFHQYRGDWPRAARAYEAEAKKKPFNAELNYRLGMAHDRCYRWDQAAIAYQKALMLDPNRPAWHYRLGFVMERQSKWREAAQAYEFAATTRTEHASYWYYRLGYVLIQLGLDKEACDAFTKSIQQPGLLRSQTDGAAREQLQTHWSASYEEELKTSFSSYFQAQGQTDALACEDQAVGFYKLGNQAEHRELWVLAADAYQAAVDRSNSHRSDWYYRLGYVLTQAGCYRDGAVAFTETRIVNKRPHGVDTSSYEKDAGLMQVMEYTEYFETLPLRENTVLYESYSGVSISCNPYAIYNAIIDDPEFCGWTHVWVLNDFSRIPENCEGRQNVFFVTRESQLYRRYLATAKWLINNSTFPTYFIRREEQRYLNTWHGTPLKTLGKDILGNFFEHKNSARNLLHATHILSPNHHTSKVLIERNDIEGLFSGKLAETGYPRNDLVVNASPAQKQVFRQRLGLQGGELKKPLVLYAPTWRGILGHPELDAGRLVADLEALKKLDCEIVFRGHYFSEKVLAESGLNVHVAPQSMDTSELLAITDVLITDYSSIFFDYLPSGRPILFYTYDIDQYRQARGLYFSIEDMPGLNCGTIEELSQALSQTLASILAGQWHQNQQYLSAKIKFCPYEDGLATRRAASFFFNEGNERLVSKNSVRKRMVLYVGQLDVNGITTSAFNFIRQVKDYFDVAVIVDVGNAGVGSRVHYVVSELQKIVSVIARTGRIIFSPESKWLYDKFWKQYCLTEGQWSFLRKSEELELRRFIGQGRVDLFINFCGYSRYFSSLIGLGAGATKKVVWLHNNMVEEKRLRFPNLEYVLNLYNNYDLMISVSDSVHRENVAALIPYVNNPQERMQALDNFVDFQSVRNLAADSLDTDVEEWMSGWRGFLFVNVARLSPEKNQKRLIEAFSMLPNRRECRLGIMGQGPLRAELESLIENKGLKDHVRIFDARNNPFPFLARGNCFVLSSDHEGQGLVLFEALALGLPVISTDIPGPRSVLADGVGVLVAPDIESLSDAMHSASSGDIEFHEFDFFGYNDSILQKVKMLFGLGISLKDVFPGGAQRPADETLNYLPPCGPI